MFAISAFRLVVNDFDIRRIDPLLLKGPIPILIFDNENRRDGFSALFSDKADKKQESFPAFADTPVNTRGNGTVEIGACRGFRR